MSHSSSTLRADALANNSPFVSIIERERACKYCTRNVKVSKPFSFLSPLPSLHAWEEDGERAIDLNSRDK